MKALFLCQNLGVGGAEELILGVSTTLPSVGVETGVVALTRRGPNERPAVIELGSLRLDPATREAWRGETEIDLSAKEFSLLETFMRHPGEVLTRLDLLEHAWDYAYENKSNVVDVYVRYLRAKIDRPFGLDSIETVRGVGYRLRADGGG